MVRTSRSEEIIRRAEKQLLNGRIRAINSTIKISSWERDTCINQLEIVLDQEIFKESQAFISMVRKVRHRHVRERQPAKVNRLWFTTSSGLSKDNSGSGSTKDSENMCCNSRGCWNLALTNINTFTATTTIPDSTITTTTNTHHPQYPPHQPWPNQSQMSEKSVQTSYWITNFTLG